MTETEQEDEAIAKQAYEIWRGNYRSDQPSRPKHWDEVGEPWRAMLRFVVAHARHFEIEQAALARGSKEGSR